MSLRNIPSFIITACCNEEDITIEHLEKSLQIVAKAIQLYGEKFLPLFVKLHDELEERRRLASYKEIALQIANSDP